MLADEARRVPGTSGDVLRVVESMPGVARATAGSGALVAWGAAPEDTRVFVDGVPVPRLYHDGGLRSVVGADLVRSVELVPGGYGAAFGRGLGGIVTVATRPLDDTGTHGSLSLDVFDLGGSVRTALSDRWHVQLAGRRSHVDTALREIAQRDVGDLFPLPHYTDAQLRIGYRASARESLELVSLLSTDTTSRTARDPDPARETHEDRTLAFGRLYLKYRRELADGSVVSVVPFVGLDRPELTSRFGFVTTELRERTTLGGVRASYRTRAERWLVLETGLDLDVRTAAFTRTGSTAAPAREGDVRVFGQPPPGQLARDTWRVESIGVAPYVEADIALFGDRVHVIPGLRIDPNARSTSRLLPREGDTPARGGFSQDLSIEPRLAVRYAPSQAVTLRAAVGSYRQPAAAQDASAAFGNPTLPPARGIHTVASAALRLSEHLSIEATTFYTSASRLAVRSPFEAPIRAEALVPTGIARSFGAQLLLRHELARGFFGWLSYSIVRSERAANDEAPTRLFDFDQTHTLTAVASYDLGAGFELGVRLRVASGYPRTQVVGAYWDARADLYQPIFGAQNGTRIPLFFQLDARASKRFHIATTELEVFLDVQNVTNRSNAEELVYDATYRTRRAITGLPILPSLGAAWRF